MSWADPRAAWPLAVQNALQSLWWAVPSLRLLRHTCSEALEPFATKEPWLCGCRGLDSCSSTVSEGKASKVFTRLGFEKQLISA